MNSVGRKRTIKPAPSFVTIAIILTVIPFLLFVSACGGARKAPPVERRQTKAKAADPTLAKPLIRIGLEDSASSALTIRAQGGLVISDAHKGKVISAKRSLPQISFFVAGSTGRPSGPIFRVQVASLRDKNNAELLAKKIRKELALPAAVNYSSQTRTYRVQVGSAATREEAVKIEATLHRAGYAETWVIRDKGSSTGDGRLVAVDAGGNRVATARRFRCAPKKAGRLIEIGGKDYRGAVELRIGADGRVLPINIVNIDEYLRGVVPAEMSPTVFPQLEALKAQAVAARTYAEKNRGQYAKEGYDICESARCQVYEGAKIEKELTDKAISETKGLVITFAAEPVNALFTSTCGGHTEDVENIFQGDAEPYLRGVVCEPESELFSRLEAGGEPGVTYGADGMPLDYEITALKIAGMLPADFKPNPKSIVSSREWSGWVGQSARRLGKKTGTPRPTSNDLTVRTAVKQLVTALGWQERLSKQVSDGDLRLLLGFEGAGRLDAASGRALLYFLRLGIIAPEPDGRLAFDEQLVQTKALRILFRVLESEEGLGAVEGKLVRALENRIEIRRGADVESHPLDDTIRLFKRFQSYTVPVRSLQMAPGDHVIADLRRGKVEAIVHTPSLEGIASDRSSRFFQWDVSYTPEELVEKMRRYASVGEIKELRPLKYGVSERIVELEVVGTEGSAVFKGLQIRWALGLRENLFVIEKSFDELGKVKTWRFIGKGWGHGVGLCQVGASGMAIAGKTYREILKHYYTGVEIEKIY